MLECLCSVCLNKLAGMLFVIAVFVIPMFAAMIACGIHEDKRKAQALAERRRAERRARYC